MIGGDGWFPKKSRPQKEALEKHTHTHTSFFVWVARSKYAFFRGLGSTATFPGFCAHETLTVAHLGACVGVCVCARARCFEGTVVFLGAVSKCKP